MEPLKQLSQNFLVDQGVVKRLLDAASIHPGDAVLEIGPGKGAITKALAKRGAKITAVEKDRRLIPLLEQEFSEHTIVEGDFLEYELGTPVKVVSNLPFHLTVPILRKCVESTSVIDIHVIVQEEMARRITALPGSKEMSLLTHALQNWAVCDYLFTISPKAFFPPPKVDCAALRLTPKVPLVPREESDAFFAFLHTPFRQRRKMLRATLKERKGIGECALKCGLELTDRPEALSLEQWWQLYQCVTGKSL